MSDLNYHNNPLDDLLEEFRPQDDPLERIIMTSRVDENAANRLFDEYFGSLIVENGVDQLQPIPMNGSSSRDIGTDFHHAAQTDICLLSSRPKTPEIDETANQLPHRPETANSKNNPGQEFPIQVINQSRTSVGTSTSFEARVKRRESSKALRDRKKTDSSRFRRRLRQSLSKLDAALNVKLGYAKRSQIEIIDEAAHLLEQDQ